MRIEKTFNYVDRSNCIYVYWLPEILFSSCRMYISWKLLGLSKITFFKCVTRYLLQATWKMFVLSTSEMLKLFIYPQEKIRKWFVCLSNVKGVELINLRYLSCQVFVLHCCYSFGTTAFMGWFHNSCREIRANASVCLKAAYLHSTALYERAILEKCWRHVRTCER